MKRVYRAPQLTVDNYAADTMIASAAAANKAGIYYEGMCEICDGSGVVDGTINCTVDANDQNKRQGVCEAYLTDCTVEGMSSNSMNLNAGCAAAWQ